MMNVWILAPIFVTHVVLTYASSKSPWFVQVVRNLPLIGDTICGGCLIYNAKNKRNVTDMVLTSASCIKDVSAAAVSVILGSAILAYGEKVAASEISSFPSYTGEHLSDDIAIIRLSVPVKFTKSSIAQPVQLAKTKWSYNPRSCRVNGFLGDGFLHELKMRKKSCYPEYENFRQGSSFCAIGPKAEDGPCAYDMGIPYVCTDYNSRPTLVGVASNKIGCRGSDHLAVFTGVVKYKSWIESTMKAMNAHK